MYKKDSKNIKDYMPNKLLYKFSGTFNDSSSADILDNKLFFDYFFRSFNLPLPEMFMFNYGNQFFTGGNSRIIQNENEFIEILNFLIKKSPTQSVFIKKSGGSWGGRGIFRVSGENIANKEFISNIYSVVSNSSFIFQETIDQHNEINRFNDSSVNTLRIDTFIDKNGNVEIISAFIRIARKKIHVDNISSGGCFVGIDIETGRLKKYAYTNIIKEKGKIYSEHPVTRVKFENFQIPFFPNVKQLVLKAASLVPALRLVGWDIAISKTGPVLIEGNKRYLIQANDVAYGGLRRNPVFKKAIDEFMQLKNSSNL